MTRPEFNEDNLGDANIFAWADEHGATLPVHCPQCDKLLTLVKLNEWSVVDIKVECMTCGGIAEGHNLRTTKMGNIRRSSSYCNQCGRTITNSECKHCGFKN